QRLQHGLRLVGRHLGGRAAKLEGSRSERIEIEAQAPELRDVLLHRARLARAEVHQLRKEQLLRAEATRAAEILQRLFVQDALMRRALVHEEVAAAHRDEDETPV